MQKTLKVFLILVLLSAFFISAGCGKAEVVAVVNDEEITRQQLDEEIINMKNYYKSMGLNVDDNTDKEFLDELQLSTLDQLITQTVLLQEAKKMGITVTKGDIDKQIDQYKETMTEENYKKTLAANGWSEPKFKEMLEKDLVISKLQEKVLSDVKQPTEQEAQQHYNENKSQFVVLPSYEVRHILIMTQGKQGDAAKVDLDARTQAIAILEQINQGADFAELAKQKSEDPGSAAQGGLYTFSPGEAVAEFEAAVKALKPGEITGEPVKTQYGYHVIKLEKVTPEKQKSYEEAKQEIISQLSDQVNQEKLNSFIENARKNAKIVNHLDKTKANDSADKADATKKN